MVELEGKSEAFVMGYVDGLSGSRMTVGFLVTQDHFDYEEGVKIGQEERDASNERKVE
jgi:hypothetical protein